MLQVINAERKSHGVQSVIDLEGFARVIGGEEACTATLGRVFEYAAQPVNTDYFQGRTSCKVDRSYIKRIVAHGLFGRLLNSGQNIAYDASSCHELFPLHLKNYFAQEGHDGQAVTVQFHRLSPAALSPAGPFQPFVIQRASTPIGEIDDAVPALEVDPRYFWETTWYDERNGFRLRHLDLMLASQLVTQDLPADAAVLVSGVHTDSSPAGQPAFTEVARRFVFLGSNPPRFSMLQQYEWDSFEERLTKYKAAFSAVPKGELIETQWRYSTDDRKLLLLMQALAAAQTGHQLLIKVHGESMAKVVELKEFMGEVAKHHPQTVLQTLRGYLPELVRRRVHLDTPEATADFLRVLGQRAQPPSPSPSPAASPQSPAGPPFGIPAPQRPPQRSPPPPPAAAQQYPPFGGAPAPQQYPPFGVQQAQPVPSPYPGQQQYGHPAYQPPRY